MTLEQIARFELGIIAVTRHAHASIPLSEIEDALRRHVSGDWGDVCKVDCEENELSLREGFRLLSAYKSNEGTTFWIITEADRSHTTILLPEEY